jgi:transcriptional regulator with XRE-family HTH domain
MASRRHHLAQRRRAVGLSQEQFAERLGIERSTVARWEAGQTEPQPWLRPKIAVVLQVSIDQLDELLLINAGSPELSSSDDRSTYVLEHHELLRDAAAIAGSHLEPAHVDRGELRTAVPAIRRALLHYDRIACGVADRDGLRGLGSLTQLRHAVNEAYRLRQAAWYSALGAVLPGLLVEAQLTVHQTADERQQAAFGLLAEANHVAAGFLKKAGEQELAWVAVDRASHAAEAAELPLLKAASAYRLANLLLDVGYLRDARDIATAAIDVMESGLGARSPEYLSMLGALFLKSAAIAARSGEQASAWQHLGEARATARRLGRNRNDFWTAFGPTNVAIHEVSLAVELGDAGTAVHRAGAVDVTGLPPQLLERRSTLLIDTARAHAQRRQDAMAVGAMLHAERIAPEEVRHNRQSRELLAELLGRERRAATPELRALAARAGLLA